MQPANPQASPVIHRTAIVDILRGWAILGVVIGNYTDFAEIGKPVKHVPSLLSQSVGLLNQYFFAAKSWTLLSVLFGYGFAVVMNNIASKGKNPVRFFSGRMFWLFVLAFINSAFWFGDILKDYALLGFILLLFHGRSAKTAFITCVVLIFSVPFISPLVSNYITYDYEKAQAIVISSMYSHNWIDVFVMNLKGTYFTEMISPSYAITVHIVMLACMLLGFAAQRIRFFDRLPEFKKQLKTLFWINLAVAIIGNIGLQLAIHAQASFLKFFKPGYWVILSTMLAIASGVCLLFISNKLKVFFNGMQAMGKMTLTNYMTQSILATLIFLNVGFGVFNTKPLWFYESIAVLVFVVQVFISKWWLNYYYYGPIEWIWRQLSYGKRLPIKKREVHTAPVAA